jgi:hypothetical protein
MLPKEKRLEEIKSPGCNVLNEMQNKTIEKRQLAGVSNGMKNGGKEHLQIIVIKKSHLLESIFNIRI